MGITRHSDTVNGFVRIVKCRRLGWLQTRVCS